MAIFAYTLNQNSFLFFTGRKLPLVFVVNVNTAVLLACGLFYCRSDGSEREEVRRRNRWCRSTRRFHGAARSARSLQPAERRGGGCRQTTDRWLQGVGGVPVPFRRRTRTAAAPSALPCSHDEANVKQTWSTRRPRQTPICLALMEFSTLECTAKVGDKVRTQIISVRDTICDKVANFVAKSS